MLNNANDVWDALRRPSNVLTVIEFVATMHHLQPNIKIEISYF